MKFLATIISGVVVGALGVYFTLDWQEEKMIFSVTSPAKFGEINYQNIILTNEGWNPAVNVKLYIDHSDIGFDNIQSTISFKRLDNEKNGIASVERLRRSETVIFSIAYKGQPLFGSEVKVVSDRSIAKQKEYDGNTSLPTWALVVIGGLGSFFALGVVSAVVIPASQDYQKRKKQAQESAK